MVNTRQFVRSTVLAAGLGVPDNSGKYSIRPERLSMGEHQHTKVFDYRGLRLLVGVIALFISVVVSVLAGKDLPSISASYYSCGRDMFVGLLFVVGAFLFAYNGHSRIESLASKIASIAAVFVAIFPTAPDAPLATHDCCQAVVVSCVHYVAAATLFSILTYFCFLPFRDRLDKRLNKDFPQQARRNVIYLTCGSVMLISMAALLAQQLLSYTIPSFTYYGETAALTAFGISWLTASKIFPWISHPTEKYRPFHPNGNASAQ